MRLKPIIMMNCYTYEKEFYGVEGRQYYLVLARLDDNKRVHLAIESWLTYKKNGGRYRLVVVGNGPCFNSLVAKYKETGVEFKGSKRHVKHYLIKARALIITSKLECYPTVAIEGKYVGTPSIAFNVPSGLRDIIMSGVDGILVPDGNCKRMAKAMLDLDSDVCLTNMVSHAYKSSDSFNANKSVDEYFKLFEGDKI